VQSEQLPKPVRVQPRIAEDAGERAALQLPVQGHRERDAPLGMLHPDVAATLASYGPAISFEGFDEALA
jgi:hypothetical protein